MRGFSLLVLALFSGAVFSQNAEPPMLRLDVSQGKLPPLEKRLPQPPLAVNVESPGKHGGTLNSLVGRSRDTRLLVVYGYARLVGYDRDLNLVPDLLDSFEVKEGRIFTLKLRKGHRWSDGHPFTTEDFRYYWEDVANNKELSPAGPPLDLLVDGQPPLFEVLSDTVVRYTWKKPNPHFLPRQAGASPLFIYRPAHYLKPFHKKYSEKVRKADAEGTAKRKWSAVHNRADNLHMADNPDLPTLQPWMNTTRPPADRFVAVRNPYFHRVDQNGPAASVYRPLRARGGRSEADPREDRRGRGRPAGARRQLQQLHLPQAGREAERLPHAALAPGKGSHFALFPNLNTNDPVWRALLRDVRFRRALSLAIDRSLVNQVLYFGLAIESNNTVLPQSPLFREAYRDRWARYDRKQAAQLLDQVGLRMGRDGIRRLPDGRPLEIIVETAGESTEQTDVLELIRETWREVGIKLFSKPSQREAFRNRIFSGETVMSVWSGLENGLATPDSSPDELAPTSQSQQQWPKFGQYLETGGKSGDPVDIPEVKELQRLYQAWSEARTRTDRERAWHAMLELHAEQQFVIGVVSGVPQPVVARDNLMNVPERGFYNWDPGAFFGIYHPDTFWFR
jgi:peptide/nickel transport system substrate-binding protein